MVNTCCVVGCHNRSGRDKKSFFSIPTVINNQGEKTRQLSEVRQTLWLARLNRSNFVHTKHSKICSDHFINGKPAVLYDETNPDWAPSAHLGYANGTHTCTTDRYNRTAERKKKKEVYDAAQALLNLSSHVQEENVESEDISVVSDTSCQVKCKFYLMGKLENNFGSSQDEKISKITMDELNRLTLENFELRQQKSANEVTEESFIGNDEKVKYYTALPTSSILMAVYNLVEAYISDSTKCSLSKFQKFILVLMRLRLNTPLQDLAYRFNVSKTTVSRVFLSLISVLYARLQFLIFWPDREELRKTMPMEFRNSLGSKVAVIIDCFEIFIERPSNLHARASTWSSYKHHNTVKYLIGITPQGVISFLSQAWGGRATDKFITENCGFLSKLNPGDIVLADRGFNIKECVGLRGAEAKIPAFTRGKKQMSPLELETSRKISHLRIHIERVIGQLRNKYTLLQDTLPIDYVISSEDDIPVIDKIATVCCALINLCESVVPFN